MYRVQEERKVLIAKYINYLLVHDDLKINNSDHKCRKSSGGQIQYIFPFIKMKI